MYVMSSDSHARALEEKQTLAEIAGAVAFPEEDLKNHVSSSKPPNIFVGSLAAAESAAFLTEHNITHVLTMAGGQLKVTIPLCVVHKTVSVADHPAENILRVLGEALAFIEVAINVSHAAESEATGPPKPIQPGGSVLVHCASGVSRSATTAIAYLMTRHRVSLQHALDSVRQNRPQASPNPGFLRQLELLERIIRERETGEEAETGVDVVARAEKLWREEASGDIMAEAQRQREVANSLHEQVDAVEVEVANVLSSGCTSTGSGGRGAEGQGRSGETATIVLALIGRLEGLQEKLDLCRPSTGDGYVDRPAGVIRKSAASKVARLLAALDEQEAT